MTSQREVKFRKWYDKFKEDNQVTFGLASEFNECWQAAQADQAETITQLQADNVKLREALESAIESTDDYDMIDRSNGKQYFKHDIFKRELEALGETR